MLQHFRIHLQEIPPVVRREVETAQLVRTRPTPLAVRKGAAIPEHPFEIQHALVDMAVPCLMHAQPTVHALDRAARAHRVGQDVPNPCVCFRPIQRQTLAQELFHDDQLRRVHMSHAMRTPQGLLPIPQTDHGLTSQRLPYSLRQLGMHPVQVVQCPRIVQQTPHFTPCLTP